MFVEPDSLPESGGATDRLVDGPLDLLLRKEQEERFMSCISELPAPQRSVLLLHFVEEFSIEEIATITESQVGTVKSRMHYAKRALKQLLEKKL